MGCNVAQQKKKNVPAFHFFGGGDVSAGIGSHKGVECVNSSSQTVYPFLLPLLELVDRAITYVAPVETPGAGEVAEAFLKGTMDEITAKCMLRLKGLGKITPDGQRGDLFLKVTIKS